MFKTKVFPSVFEASTTELIDVADDLVTGLKIQLDDTSYIVGDLALVEGTSPHKGINNAPTDLDYQLLLQAALAIAKVGTDKPLSVTTGFPSSSYGAFRKGAEELIRGEHRIQFDGRTFGGSANSVMDVTVNEVEVIREIEGVIKAAREGALQETDPFFAVSLGYGTVDAVLSLPSGPVQRTATSVNGLHVATKRMIDRLQQEHYLDMLTEHQVDAAMRQGSMIVGRRRIGLSDLREDVLRMYYDDVISPALEKAFSGSDFGRAQKMYIAGGGAGYDVLVDAFREEFGEILNVQVVPNPETFISHGFALNAQESCEDGSQRAVGIDIGNANTVVALPEEEPSSAEEARTAAEASTGEEVLSGNGASHGEGTPSGKEPLFDEDSA